MWEVEAVPGASAASAASARRWGPTPQQHVHALPLPRHRGLSLPFDARHSVAHPAAVAPGDVTAHAQPDQFAAGAHLSTGVWGKWWLEIFIEYFPNSWIVYFMENLAKINDLEVPRTFLWPSKWWILGVFPIFRHRWHSWHDQQLDLVFQDLAKQNDFSQPNHQKIPSSSWKTFESRPWHQRMRGADSESCLNNMSRQTHLLLSF